MQEATQLALKGPDLGKVPPKIKPVDPDREWIVNRLKECRFITSPPGYEFLVEWKSVGGG